MTRKHHSVGKGKARRASRGSALASSAGLAVAMFFTIEGTTRAEAPPTIAGNAQIYIQRGQSADITLDGDHLAAVASVAVTKPRGLAVSLPEADKNAKPENNHAHLHLTADADANLGTREARLISASGVSRPLHITVGQYPELLEKEPNNTPDAAQEIAFPSTIAGKIDVPGDIDCFRFNATKGQQLVFDLRAARDRSPLDSLMSVTNQAGHELPMKVDLHGGDPTAVFEVPADGPYVLSVRDLQYRGGGDFTYRIDAGVIPYVQSILPMSVQPGKTAKVKPLGVNLSSLTAIPLDLTYAGDGEISVRAHASTGTSNAMKVDVNEMPTFADEKPAHTAQTAASVAANVDISGRLEAGGEENFYKFHVARKGAITLQTITRRLGSPVDALLTLRNANGDPMQTADDSAGPEAVISRDLDPGDYLVSIRDLFFNGGPRFSYRLQIRPGAATGSAAAAADFSLRFLPDALRISKGGNAVVFVDVRRAGDFKGDVTVVAEGLPPGVSCAPLVVGEKLPGFSGMLVLSAASDAAAGSFPIRVRAVAHSGSNLLARDGTPMLDSREIEQAYLTVIDPAPFTLEPMAALKPERIAQLSAEADALAAKLAAANPQRDAAQAEWEKKMADGVVWTTLDDTVITSTAGVQFKKLDDGSILATGAPPDSDTYTLTANTDVAGITAIRLEMIPDPSLPNNGPGRNGSGNFVLSKFGVTIAPGGAPAQAKAIALHHPVADFSQDGYPVIDSIEPKPGRGWAMYPRGGSYNRAVFFTDAPTGTAEGSTLVFTFEQKFGQQHTLGRFRLSITTDPQAASKAGVPADILALLATPADKRPPEAKGKIADYYSSIDPQVARDKARLQGLRALTNTPAELARLEATLTTETPQLKAEQEAWEKSIAAGHGWLPLDLTGLKSQGGATLTKLPDESVLVSGVDPMIDTYTLTGATPISDITAIRLEALPDPRLPAGGPGRSPNGNFVLTNFAAFAAPKDGSDMARSIDFNSAKATFEQDSYPASHALSHVKDAGWAILPNAGRPSVATFIAAEPFGTPGGSALTLLLDHQFSFGHHTLGRFRVDVTANRDPASAVVLPDNILALFKVPADKRNDAQKNELAQYFRTVDPSLEPVRQSLAELKSQADAEVTLKRGSKFAVPFLLNRQAFTGDVKVTLEGYTSGRDANSSAPAPLGGALKFQPLDVNGENPGGELKAEVEGQAPFGPRYCVLRAEAKVGDDTRVEFSPPFVLTVLEK